MAEHSKKSFFGILFSSKVSLLMVTFNTIIFWVLRTGVWDESTITNLTLYPGNLLQGKIWCLVSSGFIHLTWPHLLGNMLALLIFAGIVEEKLGFWKTFFVYFGALIVSMFFSTMVYYFVMHKNVAIIGASGAVMGVLSVAMLLNPFKITYEMILPIPVMIKGWMFFYADIKGFLNNEQDGVSHLAHIFGFLSITFLVYFLSGEDRKKLRTGMFINICSLVIFIYFRQWFLKQG